MTTTALTDTPRSRWFRPALGRFFSALGQAIIAHMERHSRVDRIRRLEALTDAQLAAKGLRREDIPRHVFRDVFYV